MTRRAPSPTTQRERGAKCCFQWFDRGFKSFLVLSGSGFFIHLSRPGVLRFSPRKPRPGQSLEKRDVGLVPVMA